MLPSSAERPATFAANVPTAAASRANGILDGRLFLLGLRKAF
ncbi:hypothetical protein [Sphingomonas sp. Leaf67]|nr:hypothetical protein [Sphingomonas sp. Leaf67]